MLKRFSYLLIAAALLMLALAACAPTETPPDDAATPEVAIPTPPLAAPPATSAATDAPSGPQMECTLVADQPEAPAELVEILGVKENDWVDGPETAAVTIVEYADFQ